MRRERIAKEIIAKSYARCVSRHEQSWPQRVAADAESSLWEALCPEPEIGASLRRQAFWDELVPETEHRFRFNLNGSRHDPRPLGSVRSC